VIERRFFEPILPKVVTDRITRYAQEGRELRAVFGPDGCRLMAVTGGQLPAVVLRADNPERFAAMRSAAMLEWSRVAGQSKGKAGRRGHQRIPA
jgi:hypothetical protein